MTGPQPTEDRLLMDLIKTNRRTDGETMTKKQYEKHGDYNPWQAANRFDTWKNAKASAGIYKGKNGTPQVSDKKILEDIKQVKKNCGGQLTVQQYREKGSHSVTTIYNRFNSFKEAVEKT